MNQSSPLRPESEQAMKKPAKKRKRMKPIEGWLRMTDGKVYRTFTGAVCVYRTQHAAEHTWGTTIPIDPAIPVLITEVSR